MPVEGGVLDAVKTTTNWPRIKTCLMCYGVCGLSPEPESWKGQDFLNRKNMAYKVAIMHHGWMMGKHEEDKVKFAYFHPDRLPHICTCDCEHTWKTRNVGKCLTEYSCQRCPTVTKVDSSD